MRSFSAKLLLFSLFCHWSCNPVQKYFEYSYFQEMVHTSGDTTIVFNISDQKPELEPEVEYHWYYRDTFGKTKGGYLGHLLEGPYKMQVGDKVLLMTGTYEDGKRIDTWTSWDRQGQLVQIASYKQGLLHGETKNYKDGKLIETIVYSQNLKNGKYIRYQADSVVLSLKYKKGVPTDTLVWY